MNPSHRLLPIDAVRGTAMFFVCISHISYFFITSAPLTSFLFRVFGFFATPNFLLMSGLACGYQLAKTPSSATAMRILDRGLFVLLVGHILVAGSVAYYVVPGTALEHIVITDAIGLMLCTAPILCGIPGRRLLPAGAAIFLLSSLAGLTWRPSSMLGTIVGGSLLGIDPKIVPDVGWISATLPLLGLFILGVGVGKLICEFRRGGLDDAVWRRIALGGGAAVCGAILLNLCHYFAKPVLLAHFGGEAWVSQLLAIIDVRQKTPPSPAYALFYGGLGIALVGVLGLLPETRLSSPVVQRAVRLAAVVGRASFVSYVSQQWLIEFLPYKLGLDEWLRSPLASCAYVLAGMLIMFSIAWAWDRGRGNRYLTVGLKSTRSQSGPSSSEMLTALKKGAWSFRKAGAVKR